MVHRLSTYSLACVLMLHTVGAHASEDRAALDAALDTCTELSKGADAVAQDPGLAGWTPTETDDVVVMTILSAEFHKAYWRRSPEDLQYALDNSEFMTASILGNSALPSNQPGYVAGDLKLPTLGLKLDNPYCVLTGPSWVYDSLRQRPAYNWAAFSDEFLAPEPIRDVQKATRAQSSFNLTNLDIEQARQTYSDAKIEVNPKFFDVVDPTVLLIVDTEVLP